MRVATVFVAGSMTVTLSFREAATQTDGIVTLNESLSLPSMPETASSVKPAPGRSTVRFENVATPSSAVLTARP